MVGEVVVVVVLWCLVMVEMGIGGMMMESLGLGKQDLMRREKWRELQLSLSPISLSYIRECDIHSVSF